MDNCNDNIQCYINKCRNIINKGYKSIQNTKLSWLNTFCLEFFKCTQNLHEFLLVLPETQKREKSNHVEIIYLSLTQIVTCIRHMENTIKAEEQQGTAISSARQHFVDRIHWCLDCLCSSLKSLNVKKDNPKTILAEDRSFVELMDQVLEILSLYSSYGDDSQSTMEQKFINVAENQAQAMFDSQEIRSTIDLILGHTLAFANVALQRDKKALSALCQMVLRECMAFQEECRAGMTPGATMNESNRRLKATSLENALYKLEDYINDALLRLIFTCFLDFNKFSVDKLRKVIREREADDTTVDELIADFDVNVDRTTQIGVFAIAFAPNVKVKTVVRSCLASFESLDSCIIPSLQTKGTADIFAKLLERHFNEEVSIFKNSILEIIDSQSFAACFFELLTETINHNDKIYNKESLEDIIQMAEFLYQHFELPINHKQLEKNEKSLELFKKFNLIMQECQAVLKCTTIQLDSHRVLKRFKILRSVLRKFIDEISDKIANDKDNMSQVFLMSDELGDSQQMFNSLGITPSITSILYNNSTSMLSRRKSVCLNDSLKANYSKLSIILDTNGSATNNTRMANTANTSKNFSGVQKQRCSSLRRKESLRTALFKRKKSCESEKIYSVYKNNSDSLQISEILDQLSDLSSNL